MRPHAHPPAHAASGIGLVDLMVGLTISLVAMLVIAQVATLFEARRKSTVGMADAQLNAAGAMSLIAREIRMAGHGLGPPDSLGCDVTQDLFQPPAPFLLQPVSIIDGPQGMPDQIRVLASAATQGMGTATLIADHLPSDSLLLLDSTLGIAPDDWLVLYEPGKACSLVRATAIPLGGFRVDHALPSVTPPASYLSGARAINLGAIRYVQYSVDANRQLQAARLNTAAGSWQSAAIASEVVSLQAQYGFDVRAGPQTSPQVTRWSAAMQDADGNGHVGDSGDLRRLIAVRIALVARSAQRSDRGCEAQPPQWIAADESTGELKATDISLAGMTDWRCFRYRVLQTEIPLRNLLWSDS